MLHVVELSVVSFPSGDLILRGLLYSADGGPAPVMIWNHGSERNPVSGETLASFYTAQGYAFFAPHRHGHGQSPGDYPIVTMHSQLTEGSAGAAGAR